MKKLRAELELSSRERTTEAKREPSLLNLGEPGNLNPEERPGMLFSDVCSKLSDFSFNFFEERNLGNGSGFGENLFSM